MEPGPIQPPSTGDGATAPPRTLMRLLSRVPPRLFRAIRLTPMVGDAMLRGFDRVFPPYSLLKKRVRSGPLEGMLLEVDPRALDMVISRYEPTMQALFEQTLRRGDIAFDVGANVGYLTLVMARCVAPDGRVVSFEPNPPVASALRRNIARNANRIARVVTVPAAAGASPGHARFARAWRATRGKVVADGGDFEVEVTTVDEVAERYGPPRVLKIDVEGGELEVLGGARKVLEDAHPLVVVEVHSRDLERRCRTLLEGLGYGCHRRTDRGKVEPYLVAA